MAFHPLVALLGLAAGQPESCPPQPLPPAYTALAPKPQDQVIAFATARDMAVPARAWVVRVSRRQVTGPALVEVARMHVMRACNRHLVDQTWRSTLSAEAFDALARQVAPLVLAGRASPADNPLAVPPEIALDGVGISVTMSIGGGWSASRSLVAGGDDGCVAEAAFRDVIRSVVPRRDQPGAEW